MDKSDQGVNFAWCCCFLGTAPTAWTNVRKRKEIVHYINSFFKMDRSLSSKNTNEPKKLCENKNKSRLQDSMKDGRVPKDAMEL